LGIRRQLTEDLRQMRSEDERIVLVDRTKTVAARGSDSASFCSDRELFLQRKAKHTPLPNFAFNFYPRSMGFNDVFDDGKTEPCAAKLA
jgi:hypothetical protein